MSNKPRCRDCGHRPGPRAVTETVKLDKQGKAEARVHKKPCGCCHEVGEVQSAGD